MGTLNYHESNVATEARKRLHSLTAPATPGARAPRALVAVLLDALYHRALQQPKNVDDTVEAGAIGEAGLLYETLTDRKPGWIERSPGLPPRTGARASCPPPWPELSRRRPDESRRRDRRARPRASRWAGSADRRAAVPPVRGRRRPMAISVAVAGDGEVEILLNPDVSERRAEVVTLREGDPSPVRGAQTQPAPWSSRRRSLSVRRHQWVVFAGAQLLRVVALVLTSGQRPPTRYRTVLEGGSNGPPCAHGKQRDASCSPRL